VVIYPEDVLALLLVVGLIVIVVAMVEAARRNHQQRVYRAIIEVRENVEMEKARSEIGELYRRAREEVKRLGA
jgi:hypothetical protein